MDGNIDMKKVLVVLSTIFLMADGSTIVLTPKDAKKIGQKIWHNECKGTIAGLTSWNDGEDFASLGIGHFIWHPKGKSSHFIQSFPSLLFFLKERGIKLPEWLNRARLSGCPWNSREQFLKEFNSPRMKELRKLLASTIDLQTTFIINRLKKNFPKMLRSLPSNEQEHVRKQFNRLTSSLNGTYALIDYINFKGEGIEPSEAYQNHRWGLLQVLENMEGSSTGSSAVNDFAAAAKKVLEERVVLAPKDRNETRWIPGWFNRINTYTKAFN
ncbi:MAG TPA: hypothetical protein VHO47_03755 [Candidatus Babeliales bacterium]|nr:hypothetical protein [Candidatus Babeliales bacterium]